MTLEKISDPQSLTHEPSLSASRENDVAGQTEPLVLIEPGRFKVLDWHALWTYRELLYFLTWRDVKIRYKQTVLGASWAILQPVVQMAIFTVLFGRFANMADKVDGPFPIFVFAALLPWTFFTNAVSSSSASLVNSTNLITKVYFPRILVPLASIGVGLLDFFLASLVLGILMIWYHLTPTPHFLLLPLFLLGTVMAAVGMGLFLSALTVTYRDFRYVVPFMMQVWMLCTPIFYPPVIFPEKWRWILFLNPLSGHVEGFRAAIFGKPFAWGHIGLSFAISLLFFVVGAAYFSRTERRFADLI